MSDALIAVIAVFFVIGITVGIVAVLALSELRANRRREPARPPEDWPGPPGAEPPDVDDPRWPGDADTDFSGR